MSKEEDALLPCPADRLNGRHWARMELRAISAQVCVCVRERGGFCRVSVRLHVSASPVLGTIYTFLCLDTAQYE